MKKLAEKLSSEKLSSEKALTRPASDLDITNAEKKLKIEFSADYKAYLKTFGIISFKGNEVYGLGIPDTSYLSIIKNVANFRDSDNLPDQAVPLSEIGDGHYYVYDNKLHQVFVWASPNGGIVKFIDKGVSLENFLIDFLFN